MRTAVWRQQQQCHFPYQKQASENSASWRMCKSNKTQRLFGKSSTVKSESTNDDDNDSEHMEDKISTIDQTGDPFDQIGMRPNDCYLEQQLFSITNHNNINNIMTSGGFQQPQLQERQHPSPLVVYRSHVPNSGITRTSMMSDTSNLCPSSSYIHKHYSKNQNHGKSNDGRCGRKSLTSQCGTAAIGSTSSSQYHPRHLKRSKTTNFCLSGKIGDFSNAVTSQNMNDEELGRFRTQICPKKVVGECLLEERCSFSHCLSWHRYVRSSCCINEKKSQSGIKIMLLFAVALTLYSSFVLNQQ